MLEFHVAFGCNLTCESCAHYSNHTHSGVIAPAELERQIALWNRKIVPKSFRLLGGEPTLNRDLLDLIRIARQGWPAAGGTQLELITNGLRLERFPGLPALLEETDCRLVISVHHDGPDYARAVEPVRTLVEGWQAAHTIRVDWRTSFKRWTRRYHGYGSAMKPFADGDQRASWTNCPAKDCVQLFEGKLWKCPALAYLPMQHAKYRLGDEWQPYLRYQALGPVCRAAAGRGVPGAGGRACLPDVPRQAAALRQAEPADQGQRWMIPAARLTFAARGGYRKAMSYLRQTPPRFEVEYGRRTPDCGPVV